MAIDLSLDYHAHILPGCDHGSDSIETSLKQLGMASAVGIKTICATPHFTHTRNQSNLFAAENADGQSAARASY